MSEEIEPIMIPGQMSMDAGDGLSMLEILILSLRDSRNASPSSTNWKISKELSRNTDPKVGQVF